MSILKSPRFIWLAAVIAIMLPGFVRAQAPEKTKIVEETLRQLEKDISAARGLAFKDPRQRQGDRPLPGRTKGVQGYYSIKEKRSISTTIIAGTYERGVLIHEMVHALQDQHFGLAKLHQADSAATPSWRWRRSLKRCDLHDDRGPEEGSTKGRGHARHVARKG